MATEYEVNIKLNTADLKKDLDTVGNKIKDLGKTQNNKAKKALSNSDAVLKKEVSILATENRALRTKGQLLKLEKDGISFKNQLSKLDDAINMAKKGEVDFAKTIIQKQERAGILRRNQLATETKITEQKAKQVALSTGVASPVFGKPSQIGSPTNIAEILNNPLSPNSPVQRALKEMDDKTRSDQKQAELNRKKSLSIGKDIVNTKIKEGKAIAKNVDLEAKQLASQSQRLKASIVPQGDFSRLSDRQSRNREGRRTFMNNRFARMGMPMPTKGFDFQSALISGGFPLLFGQGPGIAAAGALGGGIGGMFGGMGGFAGGIAATAATQAIQSAVVAISDLGKAIGPFTKNSEAAITALGLQGSAQEAQIRLIEKSQGKNAAFNATMEIMASQIGQDGVKAITDFGESTRILNNQFAVGIARIQAFTASVLNFLIRISGYEKSLEKADVQQTLSVARTMDDPRALALEKEKQDFLKGAYRTVGHGGSRKILKTGAAEAIKEFEAREKILATVINTEIEAATLTEKFDGLLRSHEKEKELQERILELRRDGLNPEIAKTIAELEHQGRAGKDALQAEIDKLKELKAKMGELEPVDQARLNTLEKAVEKIDDQVEGIRKTEEATYDLNKAAEETLNAFDNMKTTIQGDIKDGIKGLIKGTSTLGDLLNNVADRFLDLALNQALFGNAGGETITGGLFKAIGFKAKGGPVRGGSSYVVGERGPELFTPGVSGNITPNNQMGGSTSVVVNVDASGSSVEGDESSGEELGRLIGAVVQAELIKERRPGGLLG